MKKITYILIVIIAGTFTSCEDYLDAPTQSSLDEQVIFSTPDLARGAVDGINVSFAETNSYRGRFLPWYGMNTDIEWYNNSDKVGDGKADLAVYYTLPNNNQMNSTNNAWAKMYEGIERANICIRGLRNYGNPEPGTELGQLLGEALTLRAVYYSDLLKAWGDVVARFDPITTETLYLPKTNRDEIYKKLIADLGEAEDLVAWPNETEATTTVERINKAFVKGLRARLCLVASGYSQYPDGIRRSTDPELTVDKMYALAKQECLDVIDQEGNSVRLETSFETVFKKNCQDDISAGGESLWEIPFADGRGRMVFTFGVRHTAIDQYTEQAKGGQAGPVPSFFYDYDVKDTRRDITCVPYEWGTATDNFAQQELRSLDQWCFGKLRYEWMSRRVTSTNDDGVNKLYMRYAEILLMAAETINEIDGPDAAAPYLKEVRRRAFNSSDWAEKVDAYIDGIDNKTDMFNAIVKENAFEFCGEMLRKQSLIRWNLLKTKLDEAKEHMYALRDMTGDYSDVPARLYYKYAEDNESLVIYGLNRGENEDKTSEYDYNITWVGPTRLEDTTIEAIYARNPDEWQFWPIWQVFLDSSNGMLTNDYGY